MKRLVLALAFGTLAVQAAGAQTAKAPAAAPPPTDQSQQRAEQEMERQMERRQMETGAATSTFDQLDTRRIGYLTAADAKKDRWLDKHFKLCDTDGDQQVTRIEYSSCSAAMK